MNINDEIRNVRYTNKLQGGSTSNPVFFKMKTVTQSSQDYCRLCAELSQTDILVPIFDNDRTRYEHMLELCLPGKFKEHDIYPRMICISCIKKLEECYKILISFMRADNIIRKIFNKELKSCLNIRIKNSTYKQGADEKSADSSVIKIRSDLHRENPVSVYATKKIKLEEIEDPLSLHDDQKKEEDPLSLKIGQNKEEDPLSLNIVPKIEYEDPLFIINNNDSVVENSTIQQPEFFQVHKNKTTEQEKLEIKYQCLRCLKLYNNKKDVTDHSLLSHPCKENNEKVFRVVMAKLRKKISTETVSIKNKDVNTKTVSNEKFTTKEIFEYKYQCIKCYQLFINKLQFHIHSAEKHSTLNRKIVCKLVKVKKAIINNEVKLDEEHPMFVKYENLISPFYQQTKKRMLNIPENNETTSEPIETYRIKYQCKGCSLLFNTYKDVLDHSEHLHPILKESGAVASVVKVKDTDDKEINLIISINDGTIIELNPNVKQTRKFRCSQQKIKSEIRFKCLKCNKLFQTKKLILQHSLTIHAMKLTHGWNEINCKMVTVKREMNYRPKIRTTYECLICCSNHVTKSGLIQHTRVFHPSVSQNKFLCRYVDPKNKQFKECLHCNEILKSYSRYREHLPKHAVFICEKCGTNLNSLSQFRIHLKSHEELKPVKTTYTCHVCETKFTSNLQLRKHKLIHNIPKEVSCSKCNKPFTTEIELKKHEQIHDTRVCDVCGKTFDAKYIQKHIQTHNIGTPYKCKSCPKTFKTQHMLWAHQRAHLQVPSCIMCQICGKVIRKAYLTLHMRIHNGLKPEVCDICGLSFRRKDHLRNHMKTHMEDRSNPCPICNIPLYTNQSYWSHLSIMHGGKKPVPNHSERPFACVICEKTFSQKSYLQDHFRKHTGEKICSCRICGKTFASRIHLWQHKFAHMDYDQLPYKCEYCDKKFKRSEHLRNHRRIHTGEKPFPCPICQRPFRVRAEMIKHTRIHKQKDEREIRTKSTKSTKITVEKIEDILSVDDSNSCVN